MDNFGINNDYQKKIDALKETKKAENVKETEETNIFEQVFELESFTEKQESQIVTEAEKVMAKSELEKFKVSINEKALKHNIKGLEKAYERIQNPTVEQIAQYEGDLEKLKDKLELVDLRFEAFLKDQNEDPTVQDFNLKLNDMTKDFTELQITTEYQRAEFSNILSGALEDYISELEEAGVQVSEATLEKLNGQLVKAQNLIEIPAIKEQKEILKFKFKAIENPTDEQKAEYEAKLAELEKEYNERKSIIVAK